MNGMKMYLYCVWVTGDKVELDIRGLKIMDRKTGLIVEEHIPKYIKIGIIFISILF